ncbi:hypothetical protein BUALT_Bualt17G0086400 [Buddleja alternifolia]|uniref:Uncharacterized protein n=1 Tax=Buddleja alternifolia TaxID=168488 RepID=A0AAV6WFH3_9LAMI|nr:hypothetical protein BUALT_Bualt17G0086400 [Buddleja alternifolia]
MVVTARIAGFIILLFVLVTGKLSNAYLVQGGDNAAGKSYIVASEREAIVKSTQTTTENKIRGRKMASNDDFLKIEKTKQAKIRAKDPKKSRVLISRENYGARFVAFNADYKGPRHHPPKNN